MRVNFLTLFLFCPILAISQFTQSIRGSVVDQHSLQPLFGVDIVILRAEPIMGASTEENGTFKIYNVPVGRVSVRASLFGYNDVIISNQEITSGKELILNLQTETSSSRPAPTTDPDNPPAGSRSTSQTPLQPATRPDAVSDTKWPGTAPR